MYIIVFEIDGEYYPLTLGNGDERAEVFSTLEGAQYYLKTDDFRGHLGLIVELPV